MHPDFLVARVGDETEYGKLLRRTERPGGAWCVITCAKKRDGGVVLQLATGTQDDAEDEYSVIALTREELDVAMKEAE